MSQPRDSSPVYYREIQKNAYLKRVPEEVSSSKLKPLVLKKPPIKPLWTVLCIHNGRTPYLEQYRDAVTARAHRPLWRHSLTTARHVTASVTAKGDQFDFLVDTDDGAVRMLAPDWDSMQDWVSTLRSKLIELRIVPPNENVYCQPRAPAAPRAAARDPTSPLPPTPHAPPQRVPGIDLTPITRPPPVPETAETEPETPLTETPTDPELTNTTTNDRPNTDITNGDSYSSVNRNTTNVDQTNVDPTNDGRVNRDRTNVDPTNVDRVNTERTNVEPTNVDHQTNADRLNTNIDISNWDNFTPLPSTSTQNSQISKKVAKICGQNICLDDSIFKRNNDGSDDEFCDSDDGNFRQTVLVSDEKEDQTGEHPTNITVIQVSNKAPHTAIPIINSENIFNFELKDQTFINVINTEAESTETNQYGTVFDGDYGHISLTTTVNLTGNGDNVKNVDSTVKSMKTEGLYERLCDVNSSPLSVRRLINQEKVRKSSLPNLESSNPNSTYEYLFLGQNNNDSANVTANFNNTPITSNNIPISTNNSGISASNTGISTNHTGILTNHSGVSTNHTGISTNNAPISTNNKTISTSITTLTSNITPKLSNITNIIPRTSNTAVVTANSTTRTTNITNIAPKTTNNTPISTNNTPNSTSNTGISTNNTGISTNNTPIANMSTEQSRVHINAVVLNNRLRSSIERSHSQNSYDSMPRRVRTNQNENIVSNGRLEKEIPKPIWKRGLTELSLLTRLRGIGQGKRQESPTRNQENDRNGVTSPNKVVHRSRPEVRADSRRRSSSLSNGESPPRAALQPLRSRQAALLRNEQRRGTALVATVRINDPPLFVDFNKQVWVCYWGGCRSNVRVGDRVAGVAGIAPKNAQHAKQILTKTGRSYVDVLFHRVPLAKIYIVNKKDQETLGIKLDNECNITHVGPDSPAARAGIPPVGKWAVTEVNNRPVNLVKGGEDDMNRLSYHGNEASILIQPSSLVKKLRAGVKGHKSLLGLR